MKVGILLCSVSLVLVSCSSLQEFPTQLNMPLPTRAHEAKVNLDIGSGGLELFASYALDTHLVVMSTTQWNSSLYKENFNGPVSIGHNDIGEDINLGYYTSLGPKTTFEALTGAGITSTKFTFNEVFDDPEGNSYFNDRFAGDIYKWFVQTDIGYQRKHVKYSIGVRLSDWYYAGNYETSFSTDNPLRKPDFDKKYHLTDNELSIDPGLMITLGRHRLKTNIMLGLTYDINGFYLSNQFKASRQNGLPLFFAVGFTYQWKR